MKCPKCGKEIDSAYYEETVTGWVDLGETDKEGNNKVEEWGDETNKTTKFFCPECDEEITTFLKM